MKTVKIKFSDMYAGFDREDNIITRLLRERYDVVFSDQPDFLIYGCFGFEHVDYDCVKIYHTGENIPPDFNFCDYAIGFDRITFGDRYLRFPLFAENDHGRLTAAAQKHLFHEDELARKTKFCNFVYSNKGADPRREEFFHLLSAYRQVDSGGRYLNNVGGPVADKLAFQQDYKFSIAFENDSAPDYTTEKLIDAFAAKTIPIYWGNPNVAMDFNPKSFINCHDYDSFDAVIERVKEIDNDPVLFRSMMAEPVFAGREIPFAFSPAALAEYLYHIFDAEPEAARRRSALCRHSQYSERMKRMTRFYNAVFRNKLVRGFYKLLTRTK